FLADAIGDGDTDLVEEFLVEDVAAVDRDDGTNCDTRRLQVDEQAGYPVLLLRLRRRPDEGEHPVGAVSLRGPDLGPADDVMIPVTDGLHLQRGQIRAGTGFGIALAPD